VYEILLRSALNHCPMVAQLGLGQISKRYQLKFSNMLTLCSYFKKVVPANWHSDQNGTLMFKLVCKLKS